MNILEQIYDIDLPKINFFERKITINNNYTILKGPPKSGKTYLIYDYLSNFKKEEYLYIDLGEYKNNDLESFSFLEEFINQNNIKVLIIENYKFQFQLPKVTSIIISTDMDKNLEDFSTLYVNNLDFEEYLLFDTKHQNISHSFNAFLKYGNFPEIIEYNDIKKQHRNYEICQIHCMDEVKLNILFLFIKSMGEKKSVFQLFNQMKKSGKISKDRFYKTTEEFLDNKLIFFIEKYNQKKAVKKLFLFNHSLFDLVTYQKKFNSVFTNMIFLELQKKHRDIYYLDNIDFYVPDRSTIVLSIPFFNNLHIDNLKKSISAKIEKYGIKKIFIITISTEFNIKVNDVDTDVITFYNWVLSQ
jgi:hypothetical protein